VEKVKPPKQNSGYSLASSPSQYIFAYWKSPYIPYTVSVAVIKFNKVTKN